MPVKIVAKTSFRLNKPKLFKMGTVSSLDPILSPRAINSIRLSETLKHSPRVDMPAVDEATAKAGRGIKYGTLRVYADMRIVLETQRTIYADMMFY